MAVHASRDWDQFYDVCRSRKIDVVKYKQPVDVTAALKPLQH